MPGPDAYDAEVVQVRGNDRTVASLWSCLIVEVSQVLYHEAWERYAKSCQIVKRLDL